MRMQRLLLSSRKHRDSYFAAVAAIDQIADEEDRRIVLETFEQVPVPMPSTTDDA